ncbi:MAG: sodium:calcium antiporter [Verrucomicrobiota bacterium]
MPIASLLPEKWFADLATIPLVAISVVSLVALIKGADWLVEAASEGAAKLGVSQLTIAATIVSIGTTTPEMTVSVLAALEGNSGMALGNAIGSIIADTGLIFGLGLLITQLPAKSKMLHKQGWLQAGSVILLAAICYGSYMLAVDKLDPNSGERLAYISRGVGVLFLCLLVGYVLLNIKWSRAEAREEKIPGGSGQPDATEAHKPRSGFMLLVMGVVGLSLVIAGGDALINSVTIIATRAGIPDAVIAGTLVAFGTSLPELMVGLTAIRKGHYEVLIGNVIGADILNVLFVIGCAALAKPIPLGGENGWIVLTKQLPAAIIIIFLMRLFIFMSKDSGVFKRWMGIPLLASYVIYVTLSFLG